MRDRINEELWRAWDVRDGFSHVSAEFKIDPRRRDHSDVIREVWDEDVYQMESLGYEGRLVVDVGAHIGSVTVRAAMMGAYVIAIEPFPEACDLLRENVSRNGLDEKVCIVQAAMVPSSASLDSPLIVIDRDGETGMGLTHYGLPDGTAREVPTIDTNQLRLMILDAQLDLALLKIDIEGWEHTLFWDDEGWMPKITALAERITMETHPGDHLGTILETLLATHSISAFGNPLVGGQIHAYRYPGAA